MQVSMKSFNQGTAIVLWEWPELIEEWMDEEWIKIKYDEFRGNTRWMMKVHRIGGGDLRVYNFIDVSPSRIMSYRILIPC